MLDVVASRLDHNPKDPKQAASDMATVLQLMEAALAANRRWRNHNYYRFRIDQHVRAVHLLCRLADLGEAACEKYEVVRMGVKLLRVLKTEDIQNLDMAEALARAARSLGAEEFDSAVDALIPSLVQACGPLPPSSCFRLVAVSHGCEARQRRFLTTLMTALGLHKQGGQLPASFTNQYVDDFANFVLGGTPGELCKWRLSLLSSKYFCAY
jgi:hypothetical protein